MKQYLKGLNYIEDFVSYSDLEYLESVKRHLQEMIDTAKQKHQLTLAEEKRLKQAFFDYLIK